MIVEFEIEDHVIENIIEETVRDQVDDSLVEEQIEDVARDKITKEELLRILKEAYSDVLAAQKVEIYELRGEVKRLTDLHRQQPPKKKFKWFGGK